MKKIKRIAIHVALLHNIRDANMFTSFHHNHQTDLTKPSFMLVATLVCICCLLTGCQPAPESKQQAPEQAAPKQAASTSAPISTVSASVSATTQQQTQASPQQTQANVQQTKSITILALGDSLTEGLGVAENQAYPAQLEAALKQAGINAKVVNSGLSGETSTGLLNRINWALKTKPDITILTIGANDAMRGIDIDTIENNIRQSITSIQQSGSRVILSGMQIYDNMGEEYVKAFASMYQRIAKDTGVAFIPFFLDGVAADSTLNQSDRIHPTAEGYTRIVEQNILPVLTPVVTDMLAENTI